MEQALANNIEELDVIAKRSDNRKRRKGRREVCESLVCTVSGFDNNILWVICDQCQRWIHSLCECFTNSESDMIESMNLYTCLKCQGKVSSDLLAYIQTRMDNNSYDQNLLESTYLQLSANCERLKSEDLDNHGIRESLLVDYLDEIKVVRQAYHGNQFVGNHCKLVLKHHEKLCSVIDDKPEKCEDI